MIMQQNWSRIRVIFIFILDGYLTSYRITNCVKGYKKHTSLLLIQPYLIFKIRSSEFRRRVKKRVDTFVVSFIFLWTASCEAEINVKTGSVQLGFLEIKLATLSEARGVFPGRRCDAMRCDALSSLLLPRSSGIFR